MFHTVSPFKIRTYRWRCLNYWSYTRLLGHKEMGHTGQVFQYTFGFRKRNRLSNRDQSRILVHSQWLYPVLGLIQDYICKIIRDLSKWYPVLGLIYDYIYNMNRDESRILVHSQWLYLVLGLIQDYIYRKNKG